MTARGSVHGRPRPSGRRRGRKVGSSTAHWASVRSMPSSTDGDPTDVSGRHRIYEIASSRMLKK